MPFVDMRLVITHLGRATAAMTQLHSGCDRRVPSVPLSITNLLVATTKATRCLRCDELFLARIGDAMDPLLTV